jgi:hypothetical protein
MNITDLFAKKIIVQNEANEEAIILDGEEKSIRTEGDIYANIYEGNQIRVGTGTSDNTDISGNTITTGHITCESISMNLLESIYKQISIGDSSIYVSGTISAASHIDISGDCVVQNEIVSSSFHTADDKCVISDGNIEVAGTCTCDELHASFFEIHENLVMDCSRGRITGRSIEVSGQINATAITTDNVTINEAGIQCNGIITANKFVIEGTNTGELITIDSGGNVQLSDGNVYINGDVRTNNGTMSVNGNLTVVDTTRTEKIYIENEEIVLGKQLHPRGTEPEEPEKSSIIIKDESGSYFYASKDSLEIGNMTNEIIITSDSIRLTESGGSQIKIDIDAAHVPKLELTDNVGNKTSVSSTRIETETIQVNSVQTDYLTLGETVYNEEVSAAYRDSIQINLANELTLAIIEKYGPEYSLLLNIYHEDPNTLNKYAISVCFKLNIGSFFVGTVVGLLGDLYFNGPDRLIFKHYDATIWGGAENLNKIKYERTGSTIVIYLYELSDIPISYDYTFAKSVGLSFG